MLTRYGVPFLIWLDDVVMEEGHRQFHAFWNYVREWRGLLEV